MSFRLERTLLTVASTLSPVNSVTDGQKSCASRDRLHVVPERHSVPLGDSSEKTANH
jgi:hypothetical protein